MPRGQRRSPAVAWSGLEQSFVTSRRLAALDPADYVRVLAESAGAGLAGGRTYDWLIAASAIQAGVDTLLTFNHRHFANLVTGIEVAVPSPDP
jgi:predicted nucleic acid-binding protein